MSTVDSFRAKGTLEVEGSSYEIYRLSAVEGASKLPFSLKVLAENLLRTIALDSGRVPERGAQQTGAWPWSGDTERVSYDHRGPWDGQKIEFFEGV